MVTSAVWSFIFLVQLVPVCGAGVSRYSGIQQHVLGEKYGVEWGKGIPIPTTWRLWDLDVDEPIVLFPFREFIGALLWIALLTTPDIANACLLYTSPSPRDKRQSRMPSSA